jgi:hypothetical protein
MHDDQNATLNSIAKDVKNLNDQVGRVFSTQKKQQEAIDGLIEWKRGLDIAKQAVDEYKRQEQTEKMQHTKTQAYNGVKDLMPYVVAVLVAAAAYLYVIASKGGK